MLAHYTSQKGSYDDPSLQMRKLSLKESHGGQKWKSWNSGWAAARRRWGGF